MILTKAGLKAGAVIVVHQGAGKPGTIIQQQPLAKAAVAPGSMVQLWVLNPPAAQTGPGMMKPGPLSQPSFKPTLRSEQDALFLDFPQDVFDVEILDAKGTLLQNFAKGRKFDITKSLEMTKAGRIFVAFKNRPGGGVPKAVPMRGSLPPDAIPYELARYHDFRVERYIYSRTIEDAEPGNNAIGTAPSLDSLGGRYEGRVGGDDAADYAKLTTGAGGFGTLVEVEVISGSVNLFLYDPVRTHLTESTTKVWIALKPNTTMYFQIAPTGAASTSYRVKVKTTQLVDVYEANDTFAQAKVFGAGRAFLGNVINSMGQHVGISDYFTWSVPEPQNLRVEVSGVGLAAGQQVQISLYDRNGSHVTSNTGNANSCTLNHDLRPEWPRPDEHPVFPAGTWRIEVRTPTAGAGSPSAYGTGTPPSCYTSISGYSLTVSVLP